MFHHPRAFHNRGNNSDKIVVLVAWLQDQNEVLVILHLEEQRKGAFSLCIFWIIRLMVHSG